MTSFTTEYGAPFSATDYVLVSLQETIANIPALANRPVVSLCYECPRTRTQIVRVSQEYYAKELETGSHSRFVMRTFDRIRFVVSMNEDGTINVSTENFKEYELFATDNGQWDIFHTEDEQEAYAIIRYYQHTVLRNVRRCYVVEETYTVRPGQRRAVEAINGTHDLNSSIWGKGDVSLQSAIIKGAQADRANYTNHLAWLDKWSVVLTTNKKRGMDCIFYVQLITSDWFQASLGVQVPIQAFPIGDYPHSNNKD